MNHAIRGATVSRNWVVGLLALGGGLAAAGSNSAWFWLLSAFVVGAGAVWALADSESNDPPRRTVIPRAVRRTNRWL